MERRVLFEDGLNVDFSIIPYAKVEQMMQHGFPPEVTEVCCCGIRRLLDREGLAAHLHLTNTELASSRPQTQAEFLEVIKDFWYHAV